MDIEPLALSDDNVETEVKLGAPADLVLPDLGDSLPDLRLEVAPTLVLEAVYHDTPDLALVRNKVSLRHRTGEGAARWTLKLPKADLDAPSDDGVLRRRELSVETEDGSTVPDRLLGLVTAWVRDSEVQPVITLRTTRRRLELAGRDDGEVVGEVADDAVEVIQGGEVVDRFREIEVEVTASATPDVLPTVTAALRFAGAGEPDPTSKVGRALGTAAAMPPLPRRVVVDKRSTIGDVTRAALAEATTVLIAADHAIRLDDDPLGARRASTSARRLRADLRTLRPFLAGSPAADLRTELGWFIGRLGRVRELDVIDARVRAGLGALDEADQQVGRSILEQLAAVRRAARAGLVTSMSSPRYVQLLVTLVAAAAAPPLTDRGGDPARRHIHKLVRRPLRKLEREVRLHRDDPSDLDLADLRRRVKHARYASQLAEPVLSSASRHLTRALAQLQDVLGELDEALVTERWLRSPEASFDDPSRSLVAGQLIAGQRLDAARARSAWISAWDAVDRPVVSAFLR